MAKALTDKEVIPASGIAGDRAKDSEKDVRAFWECGKSNCGQ